MERKILQQEKHLRKQQRANQQLEEELSRVHAGTHQNELTTNNEALVEHIASLEQDLEVRTLQLCECKGELNESQRELEDQDLEIEALEDKLQGAAIAISELKKRNQNLEAELSKSLDAEEKIQNLLDETKKALAQTRSCSGTGNVVLSHTLESELEQIKRDSKGPKIRHRTAIGYPLSPSLAQTSESRLTKSSSLSSSPESSTSISSSSSPCKTPPKNDTDARLPCKISPAKLAVSSRSKIHPVLDHGQCEILPKRIQLSKAIPECTSTKGTNQKVDYALKNAMNGVLMVSSNLV
jgi:hypothetical protein